MSLEDEVMGQVGMVCVRGLQLIFGRNQNSIFSFSSSILSYCFWDFWFLHFTSSFLLTFHFSNSKQFWPSLFVHVGIFLEDVSCFETFKDQNDIWLFLCTMKYFLWKKHIGLCIWTHKLSFHGLIRSSWKMQ